MLVSLPNLQGCLPTMQFSASPASISIVSQYLSPSFLNSEVTSSCVFGSSRFQVFRLTTWTLIAQPSEIGIRYLETSVQPETLPVAVPVTAHSTTLFCIA